MKRSRLSFDHLGRAGAELQRASEDAAHAQPLARSWERTMRTQRGQQPKARTLWDRAMKALGVKESRI